MVADATQSLCRSSRGWGRLAVERPTLQHSMRNSRPEETKFELQVLPQLLDIRFDFLSVSQRRRQHAMGSIEESDEIIVGVRSVDLDESNNGHTKCLLGRVPKNLQFGTIKDDCNVVDKGLDDRKSHAPNVMV